MRYKGVNIDDGKRRTSWHGNMSKGFRMINSKRFSVQRLRARFVYLFRLLSFSRWWRFSYCQAALKSLKKGGSSKRNDSSSCSSRTSLVMDQQLAYHHHHHHRSGSADSRIIRSSFGRSNSFYAEAIADCLEFIKRSSISVDQNPDFLPKIDSYF